MQLVLLACVLAVFFPVFGFEFLGFDDDVNVYRNHQVIDFSLANLLALWQGPHQNLYIPLTYTVWGGLAKLSALFPAADGAALNPAVFHAMNLVLHGGSVLVLFQLLRLLLGHAWAAVAGALLFAVHPVQVEAVAWVTGLKDTLCGFFSLLALWQYLAHAQAASPAPAWRHRPYILASLFMAAALLAKPGAVTVPLAAAVLVLFHAPRGVRQQALELGPWLLLALPVVLVTKFAQPDSHRSFTPLFWESVLVAGDAISFYAAKLFLPLTLGPDYGRTPQYVLGQGSILITGLLPYALALLLVWRYRRPWAMTALGVFVAPLLPVLGFIPFDFQEFSTVADRYLYVAMLGPALALGWLVASYPRRAVGLAVLACLCLLGVKSATQVWFWQDTLVYNSHAVEVNPRSVAAQLNLGVELKKAKRTDEAIAAFQKAIALAANPAKGYLNLGQLHQDKGRGQEALACYQKAVAADPAYSRNYANLCTALGDAARAGGNLEQALWQYQVAAGILSDSAKAQANLGLTYKELNRPLEAIGAYQQAIALDPGFAEVYNNLGLLYEASDKEKAVSMYQKALALDPKLGEAANNLGYLYLGMGRAEEGIPLFQRAIAVYPDHPLPHNNLGMAHASLGRLKEAAVYFEKAIALEPSFAPARDNLEKVKQQLGKAPDAVD